MKKGWKIALISLGSLLGLVLVVVTVALWLVFTPARLTSIVNRLAGNYVTCETHFDRVNLTLFKTFPDVGLDISDVYVVNPIEGAASDTVATIGNLTVGVDLKRYLKEKEVIVHQLLLDDVLATLYIDSAGNSNFDILPHSDNEEDTTESHFSLDSLPNIDIKKIKVSDLNASFINEKGGMNAEVADLDINIVGTLTEGMVDADIVLDAEKIMLKKVDSTGAAKIDAVANDIDLSLNAKGNLDEVEGRVKLKVEKGLYNDMINESLHASKKDLLNVELPFKADLQRMQFVLEETRLEVAGYALMLDGRVNMAHDNEPMKVDVKVHNTSDPWQVQPLLTLVPERFMRWQKGMDIDGKVAIAATMVGNLGQGSMPIIQSSATIENGRFHYPKAVPYKVNKINADLEATLDLNKGGISNALVNSLSAHTQGTTLNVTGRVDDLLGDMRIDATVKGNLPLADAAQMIPQGLPLVANGDVNIDLKADFRLSQIKAKAFDKIIADGALKFKSLDVIYDSIHAVAPTLDLALRMPAKQHKGKMADAHITGSKLQVQMNDIDAKMEHPDINVGINNMLREQLAAAFEIACGATEANVDSMSLSLGVLKLNGSMRMDSTQDNPLRKFNPVADIDLRSAALSTPSMPEAVFMSQFAFKYDKSGCNIKNADVHMGHSDFQLYGTVDNLEKWISHEQMLIADLNFTSTFTDVDELMEMFSGLGSDKDTLEQMREEDNVPKDANPFIVPKDVDITFHTHIRRSFAFGNDLSDVAGALTVKDGTAILSQMGFVCKAATMQLTALYRSPRPNNIFTSLDFHLLDIRIDELLDMIPAVDTLVPMLAAFDGNANFHLAGETYLDARYKPKMGTLLGSAAISGKDLVLLDDNNIAQIAKLMQFKKWKDSDNKIRIDSLDVEMTCFRKEIEVYPFLLNIGNYQLCASGKHNLSGACNYHLELLKNPLLAKVGVDVKGTLSNPKITLGEVRYADLYRPEKHGDVEKRTLELKQMIKEALEANVR